MFGKKVIIILTHFTEVLKTMFAKDIKKHPLSDHAAAFALGLNILFWAKKQG
ncbi:MAG: hypothetical protein MR922_08800 [Lachnospiraceae bacterium]|nr:hypothetical protein [Lachnospiraceae bacterium]